MSDNKVPWKWSVTPQKSPTYGNQAMFVTLPREMDMINDDYIVVFEGSKNYHVTNTKIINPYTLQVTIPEHDTAEEVKIHVYICKNDILSILTCFKFNYVSQMEHAIARFLAQSASDPEVADKLDAVWEVCLGKDYVELWDKRLAQAFSQLELPLDWTLVGDVLETESEFHGTLLHFAATHGLKELITVFLQRPGAKRALTKCNKSGLLPKDVARENGRMDLVELLDSDKFEEKRKNSKDVGWHHILQSNGFTTITSSKEHNIKDDVSFVHELNKLNQIKNGLPSCRHSWPVKTPSHNNEYILEGIENEVDISFLSGQMRNSSKKSFLDENLINFRDITEELCQLRLQNSQTTSSQISIIADQNRKPMHSRRLSCPASISRRKQGLNLRGSPRSSKPYYSPFSPKLKPEGSTVPSIELFSTPPHSPVIGQLVDIATTVAITPVKDNQANTCTGDKTAEYLTPYLGTPQQHGNPEPISPIPISYSVEKRGGGRKRNRPSTWYGGTIDKTQDNEIDIQRSNSLEDFANKLASHDDDDSEEESECNFKDGPSRTMSSIEAINRKESFLSSMSDLSMEKDLSDNEDGSDDEPEKTTQDHHEGGSERVGDKEHIGEDSEDGTKHEEHLEEETSKDTNEDQMIVDHEIPVVDTMVNEPSSLVEEAIRGIQEERKEQEGRDEKLVVCDKNETENEKTEFCENKENAEETCVINDPDDKTETCVTNDSDNNTETCVTNDSDNTETCVTNDSDSNTETCVTNDSDNTETCVTNDFDNNTETCVAGHDTDNNRVTNIEQLENSDNEEDMIEDEQTNHEINEENQIVDKDDEMLVNKVDKEDNTALYGEPEVLETKSISSNAILGILEEEDDDILAEDVLAMLPESRDENILQKITTKSNKTTNDDIAHDEEQIQDETCLEQVKQEENPVPDDETSSQQVKQEVDPVSSDETGSERDDQEEDRVSENGTSLEQAGPEHEQVNQVSDDETITEQVKQERQEEEQVSDEIISSGHNEEDPGMEPVELDHEHDDQVTDHKTEPVIPEREEDEDYETGIEPVGLENGDTSEKDNDVNELHAVKSGEMPAICYEDEVPIDHHSEEPSDEMVPGEEMIPSDKMVSASDHQLSDGENDGYHTEDKNENGETVGKHIRFNENVKKKKSNGAVIINHIPQEDASKIMPPPSTTDTSSFRQRSAVILTLSKAPVKRSGSDISVTSLQDVQLEEHASLPRVDDLSQSTLARKAKSYGDLTSYKESMVNDGDSDDEIQEEERRRIQEDQKQLSVKKRIKKFEEASNYSSNEKLNQIAHSQIYEREEEEHGKRRWSNFFNAKNPKQSKKPGRTPTFRRDTLRSSMSSIVGKNPGKKTIETLVTTQSVAFAKHSSTAPNANNTMASRPRSWTKESPGPVRKNTLGTENTKSSTEDVKTSVESPEDATTEEPIDALDLEVDSDLENFDHEPETWCETVEKKIVSKMSKKEIKRQDIILELIKTEYHHLRTLKIMQQVFYRGLNKWANYSWERLDQLFPRINELVDLSVRFHRNLRCRQDEEAVVNMIGDVLVKHFTDENGEAIKDVYGEFVSKHQEGVALYKHYFKTDKKFSNFIKKCHSHRIVRRLSVPECFTLVTQRLTKYPPLIEAIMKVTKASSPDHKQLQKSLTLVKEALQAVDNAIKDYEKQTKLKDIKSRMEKGSVVLKNGQKIKNNRFVSYQSKMVHDGVLQWKSARGKLTETHVVLLQSLVAFLQENDKKFGLLSVDGKAPYIALKTLMVREVATDKNAIYFVSTSQKGPEMYEFVCNNHKEKKHWMAIISDAISKAPNDIGDLFWSPEEEKKQAEERLQRRNEIIELMKAKDQELASCIDEKDKLATEMKELLQVSYGNGKPKEDDKTMNVKKVKEILLLAIRQTTHMTADSIQRLHESHSDSELAAVTQDEKVAGAPKRAETFGGFDRRPSTNSKGTRRQPSTISEGQPDYVPQSSNLTQRRDSGFSTTSESVSSALNIMNATGDTRGPQYPLKMLEALQWVVTQYHNKETTLEDLRIELQSSAEEVRKLRQMQHNNDKNVDLLREEHQAEITRQKKAYNDLERTLKSQIEQLNEQNEQLSQEFKELRQNLRQGIRYS